MRGLSAWVTQGASCRSELLGEIISIVRWWGTIVRWWSTAHDRRLSRQEVVVGIAVCPGGHAALGTGATISSKQRWLLLMRLLGNAGMLSVAILSN